MTASHYCGESLSELDFHTALLAKERESYDDVHKTREKLYFFVLSKYSPIVFILSASTDSDVSLLTNVSSHV